MSSPFKDIIDVIYVLKSPDAAASALEDYSNTFLDGRPLHMQYIKHDIEYYKKLNNEDPLEYTKQQFVKKATSVARTFYHILTRIASIKYGIAIVEEMYKARSIFLNNAPPKYKDFCINEPYEDVLAFCINPPVFI